MVSHFLIDIVHSIYSETSSAVLQDHAEYHSLASLIQQQQQLFKTNLFRDVKVYKDVLYNFYPLNVIHKIMSQNCL